MSDNNKIKTLLSMSTTMPQGTGQKSPFGGPLLTGSHLHGHTHGPGCGCNHAHDDEDED